MLGQQCACALIPSAITRGLLFGVDLAASPPRGPIPQEQELAAALAECSRLRSALANERDAREAAQGGNWIATEKVWGHATCSMCASLSNTRFWRVGGAAC